jgi:tetratricopeptide (TPR) repeat protein
MPAATYSSGIGGTCRRQGPAMRPLLFALLTALSISTTSVPGSMLGPEVAFAQAGDARARARAAYNEAQRLFDAGDFAGALEHFQQAYDIGQTAVVLLAIASAQERLGRPADARATLERYLRERPDAPDRADVERRIAALPAATAPATGTVTVTSDPPGAAIVVDGESSGATAPTELTLGPGEHSIALALSGYELATESVTVTAGGTHTVSATLTAMPEPEPMDEDAAFGGSEGSEGDEAPETPAPSSDPSAATWVMTTVAGVALVTGTVFGFLALSRQSDFDVTPTRSLADEGEAFALAADLSFGVAVAAGITAIVLYAVDRPSAPAAADTAAESTASVSVVPIVSPNGGGAALGVTF